MNNNQFPFGTSILKLVCAESLLNFMSKLVLFLKRIATFTAETTKVAYLFD